MDRNSKWMTVSGLMGFSFFLIANYTNFFEGSNVLAGFVQLCINAFVFTVGIKVFPQSTGKRKKFALLWVVFPPIMASITIYRVLLQ